MTTILSGALLHQGRDIRNERNAKRDTDENRIRFLISKLEDENNKSIEELSVEEIDVESEEFDDFLAGRADARLRRTNDAESGREENQPGG